MPVKGGTPATATLDRCSVTYSLHSYEHEASAESFGEEAAALLGIDPHRIFKTLIASVEGRLVCAIVPVAGRLNLKALAGVLHAKKAEMAEPAKAQRATGYVLGGISPLGHRTVMPIVLDISALELDTMFVSAGKRGLQVQLSPADLISCTKARIAEIART